MSAQTYSNMLVIEVNNSQRFDARTVGSEEASVDDRENGLNSLKPGAKMKKSAPSANKFRR